MPPADTSASRRQLLLLAGVFLLAAAVRLPGLLSRGIWYDEAISLLESSGHAAPSWPRQITPAAAAKESFVGAVSLAQVTEDLRRTDTHPPLYFWALALWRPALGFDVETARALSLVFSLGSVLLFFLLLKRAHFEYPLGATLFYSLATGAVHNGHEARPYALAGFLLLAAALSAWLAFEASPQRRGHAAIASAAMAAACAGAFATSYLALFPVGALLAWFLWSLWPRARALALAAPLATLALAGLVVPVLLDQMGTRGHQFRGFAGVLAELLALVKMNAQQAGIALSLSGLAQSAVRQQIAALVAAGGIVVLTALSIAALRRRGLGAAGRLWALLAALAVAPSAGLFLLDLAFDKRLHEPRYLSFAVPALAAILIYGVLDLASTKRRAGVLLFAALMASQATRLNWGSERCVRDQTGSLTRGVAELIEGIEAPSRVVAIAAGVGRGDPASWIYELEARTPILVFGIGDDLGRIVASIDGRADVWITSSSDKLTFLMEEELVERLEASGRYLTVFRSKVAHQLVRVQPGR